MATRLLFALLGLLPAVPAAASAPEVRWRPFLDGYFRPGHWLPFELTVTAKDGPYQGNVAVSVHGEIELRYRADLPGAGFSRTFDGCLLPRSILPEVEVQTDASAAPWRYGDPSGGEEGGKPLKPLSPDEVFAVYVGESPLIRSSALRAALAGRTGKARHRLLVLPHAAGLPKDAAGLEAVDVLVMGEPRPWPEDRGEAVAAWVRSGGRLIVADHSALSRPGHGFLHRLLWPKGLPFSQRPAPGPSLADWLGRADGRVVFDGAAPDDGCKVLRFDRGRGSVAIFWPADTLRPPDKAFGEEAVRKAIECFSLPAKARAVPMIEPAASPFDSRAIFKRPSWPEPFRAAAARGVSLYLVLAVLLVVPLWRVLRRPLLGLIALAVAAAGALAFLESRVLAGAPAVFEHRNAILGRAGEADVQVFSICRLVAFGDADMDLRFRPSERPRPVLTSEYADDVLPRTVVQEDRSSMSFRLPVLGQAFFAVERRVAGAPWALASRGDDGYSITNASPFFRLSRAWVYEGGRFVLIGDLESGCSRTAAAGGGASGPFDPRFAKGGFCDANWARMIFERRRPEDGAFLLAWIEPGVYRPAEGGEERAFVLGAPAPTFLLLSLPR